MVSTKNLDDAVWNNGKFFVNHPSLKMMLTFTRVLPLCTANVTQQGKKQAFLLVFSA